MFFRVRGTARYSLGISVAAYTVGILLAGTVTALGSYRVVTTLLAELAPGAISKPAVAAQAPERSSPLQAVSSNPLALLPRRDAFMTPLHSNLGALSKARSTLPSVAQPVIFGTSSRYGGRPARRGRDEDRDDDEERGERPQEGGGTYRTMCVRLCDGYYFPVSFTATRNRFAKDAKTCENSCGGQARLFVYRNPGSDVQDMVDLRGQPYNKLSTAFLYRTEYVPACRCKPNPWDAEAQDRHRMYALAVAKRKGSKQAAAELDVLAAKVKASRPARSVQVAAPAEGTQVPSSPTLEQAVVVTRQRRSPERADDRNGRMALGARTRERPARSSRDADWIKRAFGQSN